MAKKKANCNKDAKNLAKERKMNSGKRRDSWNDRESRDMRRDERRDVSKAADKLSSLNDFSWYNRYPELIEGAARVPFPYRPGRELSAQINTSSSAMVISGMGIPGIMALDWIPSIGYSDGVLSPASISAKEIYAKVRSKFSGSLDADAPDFVVYLMALDSIYSYIGWLKRLYKVCTTYSPSNYVLPEGVAYALGLHPDTLKNLVAQKADLWTGINTLIRMTDKFIMPDVMDLFRRHYWMNENIYTDAPTINSQMYIFNQVGFYKFKMLPIIGDTSHTAGGLEITERPLTNSSSAVADPVARLINFGRDLITALAESDDAYTISGYLMKAYEGSSVFTVTLEGLDESITPVYVEEVLAQIENSATVFNQDQYAYLGNVEGTSVQQSVTTNALISKPTITTNYMGNVMDHVPISIRSDVPSVPEVVVATRLKAFSTGYDAEGDIKLSCATELPLIWRMYLPNLDGTYQDFNTWQVYSTTPRWLALTVPTFDVLIGTRTNDATMNNNSNWSLSENGGAVDTPRHNASLFGLLQKSQFDWAPICYLRSIYKTGTTEIGTSNLVPVGDIHNFTLIPTAQMAEIHRMAVYSEYNAFTE